MTYWERRAAEDMKRAQREAAQVLGEIEALHAAALGRVRETALRIRRRFMRGYALTREEAEKLLKEPCGREEYLELLGEIERLGKNNPKRARLLARAAAPAYAYRESVATAMEDEVAAVTAKLAEEEEAKVREHLMQTAVEQSLRAGYRIQQQAGVGFAFGGVSEELARVMIAKPWSGAAFSARIWQNRDALADVLNEALREGLTTGRSGEAIAQEIAGRMNVSVSRARTLVRTETTHICTEADFAAFDEAGIERYQFSAVLDMKTSEICQKLDGKVFTKAEKKVGVNCPPMHPNCRSQATCVLDKEDEARMTRWARDPVTGKGVKVPMSMTYEEWLQMQKETYGEERIEAARKMALNEGRDKKQLAAYQAVLGKKHLPATLAKFQQMKYTDLEEWEKTQRAYRTIGEIDAKDTWKASFREQAKDLYWTMRGNDVEMSAHSIARYYDRIQRKEVDCDVEKLIRLCQMPANYIQSDGRQVKFYEDIALIFSVETGEMVSFVPRKVPKSEWRRTE